MRIELAYNETVFYKKHDLHFDIQWAEFLKTNRERLIWVALAVFLGALLVYDGQAMGWAAIGVGVQVFIYFSNNQALHKRSKKVYFEKLDKLRKIFEEADSPSYCEVSEDHFLLLTPQFDTKIQWVFFEGYRLIEDTLFLEMDQAAGLAYLISRSEIQEDGWNALTDIASRKLSNLLEIV